MLPFICLILSKPGSGGLLLSFSSTPTPRMLQPAHRGQRRPWPWVGMLGMARGTRLWLGHLEHLPHPLTASDSCTTHSWMSAWRHIPSFSETLLSPWPLSTSHLGIHVQVRSEAAPFCSSIHLFFKSQPALYGSEGLFNPDGILNFQVCCKNRTKSSRVLPPWVRPCVPCRMRHLLLTHTLFVHNSSSF